MNPAWIFCLLIRYVSKPSFWIAVYQKFFLGLGTSDS
ncbi:hypothetical protein ACFSR1_15055 [Aquimarina rubra]|uniref:Uncharacterized protein n=1 Tax=Aquimarina rubra TaxID=1920033 RepID=A0ABW5LJG1_9FLAO